jgi:hypothetical protein
VIGELFTESSVNWSLELLFVFSFISLVE